LQNRATRCSTVCIWLQSAVWAVSVTRAHAVEHQLVQSLAPFKLFVEHCGRHPVAAPIPECPAADNEVSCLVDGALAGDALVPGDARHQLSALLAHHWQGGHALVEKIDAF
jgi:hypothetical protein